MPKQNGDPKSLSEAIEQLEGVRKSKTEEFKEIFEKDIHHMKRTIEELKPHFESLKGNVESEVRKTKGQVEDKMRTNPWVTLGMVGLIAFVIGWILGTYKKDDE